ncbi:hypothetical protein [Altererythrobacter sp. MF3-039]|uniref:hypothetical protein n=1 Tax=Altererythrobacter sp. MF3-039 TaxID=3252901 RepID=UPI00390C49BD
MAWTPQRFRLAFATLLALDQRLARIVSQATEPMLAQIRLAWWRDELAKPLEMRLTGDAVLDAIGESWRGEEAALSALVDAWELLLIEPPLPDHIADKFVQGRAEPFAAHAKVAAPHYVGGATDAATIWAAMDAAIHASDASERSAFRARTLKLDLPNLPKSLRGLVVLAGLSRRTALRDEPILMAGRGGAVAALRLGIFGR